MSFYTRTGDEGTTGLLGKERVKKYDLRMQTIGSLDEASTALGLARAFVCSVEIKEITLKLQVAELRAVFPADDGLGDFPL